MKLSLYKKKVVLTNGKFVFLIVKHSKAIALIGNLKYKNTKLI